MRATIAMLLLGAAPAAAQTPAWTLDVTTASYVEAWEVNESVEHLLGVQAGVDRRVWRGIALRSESLIMRVRQKGADAWLRGVTLAMRTRTRSRRAQAALDIGGGWSSATSRVPPTGTRVNYLVVLGGGLEVPLPSQYVALGVRWLHVSNGGREGRLRNPDLQTLGGYAGLAWKF